jgi:uncharacterized membrane protein
VNRRLFIDWMRGVAVLCMIEHHTFDALLSPSLHGSAPDRLFRFLGGVAAPGFLFLAGLAVALTLEEKPRATCLKAARRGLLILAGAYAFRFQEWALAGAKGPWREMLRIDILNTIGVALVLVALAFALFRRPLAAFVLGALLVAGLAPIVWAAPLDGVPQLVADYLHGGPPRALFPLFPWLAHAFAGAAVGVLFARARRAQAEDRLMLRLAAGAAALCVVTLAVDALPFHLYSSMSWWHTSPAYFLLRTVSNVLLLCALWLLERLWQPARAGVLAQLGRHSLVVYWVHVELVYGRWFWRARGTLTLAQGAVALAGVLLAMVGVAYLADPIQARARLPRVAVA